MRFFRLLILTGVGTIFLALTTTAYAVPQASPFLRVNQVGYRIGNVKYAYLMSSTPMDNAAFTLLDSQQTTVYQSTAQFRGAWSQKFSYVYLLDFSSRNIADTYTIQVGGVTSPAFRIDTGANLFAPLVENAQVFYQAQRDGANVNSAVLNRQPSHLNDAHALVYRTPKYEDVDGVPVLARDLKQVGGPVDASGGWFDAGDYLKFVQTTSFTTGLMLFAVRESPTASSHFLNEARVGVDWLDKMWDEETQTLYYQVGIGDGNGETILGDHDLWRLPEFDDAIDLDANPEWKYVKQRPVLRAGKPSGPISPNLAGRLAATFALCYQVYRVSDPAYAENCLRAAEQIFDLAKTQDVNQLLTAVPYDFYPESEWRDDMEWGAVELYRALAAATPPNNLPHSDPMFYLEHAAQWAKKYNKRFSENFDTFNLYDVGGLAHYELHRALGTAGHPNDLAVSQTALVKNLKRHIEIPYDHAQDTPFQLGWQFEDGDPVPHTLGLALMASWYKELSNDIKFADFAQAQLNWVLGANPWGASFVIGAGTAFPRCPQHQIANLAGALDGTSPILLGAVVNGPAPSEEFQDIGAPEEPTMPNQCPVQGADVYKKFSGDGVRYKDDVRAWMSVEPTLDYTILSVLAFARQIE